jgi:hypothetical protein
MSIAIIGLSGRAPGDRVVGDPTCGPRAVAETPRYRVRRVETRATIANPSAHVESTDRDDRKFAVAPEPPSESRHGTRGAGETVGSGRAAWRKRQRMAGGSPNRDEAPDRDHSDTTIRRESPTARRPNQGYPHPINLIALYKNVVAVPERPN